MDWQYMKVGQISDACSLKVRSRTSQVFSGSSPNKFLIAGVKKNRGKPLIREVKERLANANLSDLEPI